ncbi:MAG: hypothetical protein FPO08_20360 [Geobacter sp.]|uniref:hypothetical protein n=1 Tax=Geomonas ferrireducens TaxID=2570227 RepID=UPI0010A8EEEA|nr:hypothetical protein [Geomonas ferrireducens]TSK04660.1 MAG: hypothetical protein FPO08_20360 [Geobacter sp.]
MPGNNSCQKCHSLKAACDEAFYTYPKSCSHAVWHVIRKYVHDQPYLTANNLLQVVERSPRWQEVQIHELAQLANDGVLVIGGAAESTHGHVIVVYPGQPKNHGGYSYLDREGRSKVLPSYGIFPLAMSTSIGSWPGAKSKGDRTIADPWSREKFKHVRFYKYVGTPYGSPDGAEN